MTKRDRRIGFRIVGSVLLLLGVVFRMNPRAVLPNVMTWSGDFASSEYGLRVAAFADLMNIVVLTGIALIVLSFTTLTDVGD